MDGTFFIGTWWSLVPPLLAILLALITKEVDSSLFIGVTVGALMYTGFHPWNAFVAFFDIMKSSMNLNILIFDVLLGMIITDSLFVMQVAIILTWFFIMVCTIALTAAIIIAARYQNEKTEKEVMLLLNKEMMQLMLQIWIVI